MPKRNSLFFIIMVLISLLTVVFFFWIFRNHSSASVITPNQVIDFEDVTLSNEAVHTTDKKLTIQTSSGDIWIDSEIVHEGKHSLGINLRKNELRREIRIADIPNNKTEIIRFSVYFDKYFQIPENWTVFAQWWQGAPASPPIAFEINPNSKKFEFRILTRAGPYENNNTTFRYNKPIERGKWHDFIVEMRIDDTGGSNGLLNVWLNDNKIVNYEGALGYPDLRDNTNFRLGLYRDPAVQESATIYFDSIQIGDRTF